MPGTPYVTEQSLANDALRWAAAIAPFSENRLAALDRAALIVVDMQRYFVHPEGRAYLPAARAIVSPIADLVAAFAQHRRPIIRTRHGHEREGDAKLMATWWNGRLLYEDDPQAELTPELGDAGDHIVVRKQNYDAFEGTELHHALDHAGARTVVLCGVMTDLCVETTARRAFTLGFQPVVALDATASKNEELHLSALRTLAHGFAYVDNSQRIIELLS